MTTFSTCTICHSLTLLYPWPLAQAASLQAGPSSARGGESNTPGDQHSALRRGLEQNGGSTAVLCAMRVWLRSRRLRRLGHSNHLVKRQNPFVADLGFRTAGVLYPVYKTNRPGGANQDQAFRSVRDWSFAFRGGLAAQDNCVTQTLHGSPETVGACLRF